MQFNVDTRISIEKSSMLYIAEQFRLHRAAHRGQPSNAFYYYSISPNGRIMEISCIIDSMLILDFPDLFSPEAKKRTKFPLAYRPFCKNFNWFQTTLMRGGKGDPEITQMILSSLPGSESFGMNTRPLCYEASQRFAGPAAHWSRILKKI